MTAPHRELELKAVVPDPEQLRRRLRESGAELSSRGRMIDVRYDRGGELTLHDEVLRARTYRPTEGDVGFLLAWKGPTGRSPDGYKLREEIELPVGADPGLLLQALGYRPVHVVHREVEVWRLNDATARLERYPRMDVLVEVEGAPAAIERVVAASGIPRHEFTAEPLTEFVRRFEERTGAAAELAGASW
ncbi:MAG TPA: CYTH domain-containing protein [Gemmatimonadales bacterium]|nr:CYTH domain-containing protein [Gemmatimonadales bacterium]